MLSSNQRKQIVQLSKKKYRERYRLFVAEGEKNVRSLLEAGYQAKYLIASRPHPGLNTISIDSTVMDKITQLKNSSPILGVFHYPEVIINDTLDVEIALDNIRDPGNLGTIIRLCDWFGLNQLICSTSSVDCFNSKVIQASMGSIARVSCKYVDLNEYLKASDKTIYGATLGGDSLYTEALKGEAIFVFGNEAHGISEAILELIDKKISIPRFKGIDGPESLNVANATGIFLSEIFRPKV